MNLQRKGGNGDILGQNSNWEIVTDESVLAGVSNDYFVNIAANLKEPIEESDFTTL